jgi:hypothetical protein
MQWVKRARARSGPSLFEKPPGEIDERPRRLGVVAWGPFPHREIAAMPLALLSKGADVWKVQQERSQLRIVRRFRLGEDERTKGFFSSGSSRCNSQRIDRAA